MRAETKRQAAAIHAYRLLQLYDKPIRNRSDAESFLGWLRAEGLGDCTIRLPDVEAAMLVEVQKRNKDFRDLQGLVLEQIRQQYRKA